MISISYKKYLYNGGIMNQCSHFALMLLADYCIAKLMQTDLLLPLLNPCV